MCLYSTINAQEFSTEQCLKDLKLAADNANEVSAKILSPQTYKKALAAQGKANSTSKKRSIYVNKQRNRPYTFDQLPKMRN